MYFSHIYAFMKFWIVISMHFLFKMKVRTEEDIPKNEPVFYAPNHQNELFDATLPAAHSKAQVRFVARADMFYSAFVDWLFRNFGMIPIFRKVDGYKDTKTPNKAIFELCIEKLKENAQIILFPEGRSEREYQLLKVKKGMARISLLGEQEANYEFGLKIIPVGLYYEKPERERSEVLIYYGKPIHPKKYKDLYEKDSEAAVAALTEEIKAAMLSLIVNIYSKTHYHSIEFLWKMYTAKMVERLELKQSDIYHRLLAGQKITKTLDEFAIKEPEAMNQLAHQTTDYQNALAAVGLKDKIFDENTHLPFSSTVQVLFFVLTFPLFLYGFLNNGLPYYTAIIPAQKNKKKAKFHFTALYICRFVLFPTFYLLQFLIVWYWCGSYLAGLAYMLTLPFFGLFASKYGRLLRKWGAERRYHKLKKTAAKQMNKVLEMRTKLLTKLDGLVPGK